MSTPASPTSPDAAPSASLPSSGVSSLPSLAGLSVEDQAGPPIVVQKYGGSSVATPERLRQVAARVAETARRGLRVVVVVSAMGKTTDELIALARTISPNPARRELDMLLTCGERISMALLAMALSDLGVPAISFTGSQSGILTNDRHSGARIIEVRPVRIQDELDRGRVVIVAGFQGMSYKREITTLGRGGSDTTAVALAAALSAQQCEIYSDVDGVYSADPRVVPEAAHIPYLGHAEMQELASHGAKVLNAQAVEWAQRAGIVIHARKTAGVGIGGSAAAQEGAADGHPRETRIGPAASNLQGDRRATAIASTARLLHVTSPDRGGAVLDALSREGVELREVELEPQSSGGQALSARFVRDDLPDFERTAATLREAGGPTLDIDDSCGSVTAVGPGIGASPALLLDVDRTLRQAGISVVRYRGGALRLSLYLPVAQVTAATQLLHRLLCTPTAAR